jgi:hypothetical protein
MTETFDQSVARGRAAYALGVRVALGVGSQSDLDRVVALPDDDLASYRLGRAHVLGGLWVLVDGVPKEVA